MNTLFQDIIIWTFLIGSVTIGFILLLIIKNNNTKKETELTLFKLIDKNKGIPPGVITSLSLPPPTSKTLLKKVYLHNTDNNTIRSQIIIDTEKTNSQRIHNEPNKNTR